MTPRPLALERVLPWLAPILFALLAAAIYANSLDVPFYFDDIQNIVINKSIHLDELSWAGLQEAATSKKPTRAVAFVTFALSYYLGGEQVAGYHVVNIAIHAINASLVFWLILLTLRLPSLGFAARDASLIAFIAALLWLVNPVQTQTVTYIVQRWNSLAVMFYLGAFLLYIHARLAPSRLRRWLLFTGCALSAALGFFTKEITAVLPAFILLYEWFFFQDLKRRWLWRNIALIAALVLVLVAVGTVYTDHYHLYRALLDFQVPEYNNRWFTVGERLLTEPRVVLFYLGLLLLPLPSRLNLDHDFPLSYALWDPPATFFAIATLIALVVLAAAIARRQRLLAFCILWYLGHLVIESSVIGLEIIYEHRSYLPSIGVFLLLVLLAFRTGLSRRLLVTGFCLLAGLWSVWTVERNALWSDPEAFWLDVTRKSPDIVRAYHALGLHHQNSDRHAEAEAWYTRAIDAHERFRQNNRSQAKPKWQTTLDYIQSRAYFRRGNLRLDRDALPGARDDFTACIRISGRTMTRCIFYRGVVNQKLGNDRAALKDYSRAIRFRPGYYDIWHYRGDLHYKLAEYHAAAGDYRKMTEIKPDDPVAHRKLGKALVKLGDDSGARQAFGKSLEVAPVDWKWRKDVQRRLLDISQREPTGAAP